MQPVDSTSRLQSECRHKFTVLFYVQNIEYKLCVTKESDQKVNLETFISHKPIEGKKEVDWYRVDNTDKVKKIIEYAAGNDVEGVTYNLVHGLN